jgi:murein DD-endopeptidase MepM/ murein hydrolase activator NlpD
MSSSPAWQSLLLWQAPDDEISWACPWCGKKDNAFRALLCPACGYPVWNPGRYLVRPVDTDIVTRGFAPGHKAVDLGAREGSPVYAAADGVVVEARRDRWAGNVVRLEHDGGVQTLYGHLREIRAGQGCFVGAGEVVAWSGSTGAVTGPHLHFEVIVRGEQVDPLTRLAP